MVVRPSSPVSFHSPQCEFARATNHQHIPNCALQVLRHVAHRPHSGCCSRRRPSRRCNHSPHPGLLYSTIFQACHLVSFAELLFMRVAMQVPIGVLLALRFMPSALLQELRARAIGQSKKDYQVAPCALSLTFIRSSLFNIKLFCLQTLARCGAFVVAAGE